MTSAHRSLRLFACLLIAGLELARASHGPHGSEAADRHESVCSHARHGEESSEQAPSAPAPHDDDDCPICHFIAAGSTAIQAARPTVMVAAQPVQVRIAPVVVEPHSADVALPCAARAPPVADHVA